MGPASSHRLSRWSAACLAAAGLCLASGCSGDTDGFYPVRGKVTAGGQPIKRGSISFRPLASKGNQSLHHPAADIDAEGNYQLYTISKPGAPPGWYRVLVFADGNPSPAPGVPPRWLHHVKYTTEGSTDMLIEVVKDPPAGHYDLKLAR
jgi:hypothetical protein